MRRARCIGVKGAVWQCNRAFRAFEWLFHRPRWAVAANYVGDYTLAEPEATAAGAVAAAEVAGGAGGAGGAGRRHSISATPPTSFSRSRG